MKRVLVGAAALAAVFSVFGAQRVVADDDVDTSNTLTAKSLQIVNKIVKDVPVPDGWHLRHVCVIDDHADKSICLYFPWPI